MNRCQLHPEEFLEKNGNCQTFKTSLKGPNFIKKPNVISFYYGGFSSEFCNKYIIFVIKSQFQTNTEDMKFSNQLWLKISQLFIWMIAELTLKLTALIATFLVKITSYKWIVNLMMNRTIHKTVHVSCLIPLHIGLQGKVESGKNSSACWIVLFSYIYMVSDLYI